MKLDYIRDNPNIKNVIQSIIHDNDLNINIIERRLKIPRGSLSSWLDGTARKLGHEEIISVLNRLGVTADLVLRYKKIDNVEQLRNTNPIRKESSLAESRRITKEFIGDE